MNQKKTKKLEEKQTSVVKQQQYELTFEKQPKKDQSQKIERPEVRRKQQVKKIKDQSKRLQIKPDQIGGIVYIGRLPYGFVEEGIKEYFTQFGVISGVKLIRSKKTNRGQGYGFVKFQDKEVAKIAAESMNGYMMLGKQIVAQLLDEKHPDPFKYKDGSRKLKFIKWQQVFKKHVNKEKNEETIVKEIENLLKNEKNKRFKLNELGLAYQYKGFVKYLFNQIINRKKYWMNEANSEQYKLYIVHQVSQILLIFKSFFKKFNLVKLTKK